MRPPHGRHRRPLAASGVGRGAALGLALALLAACGAQSGPGLTSPSAPYVGTPSEVGVEMLKLAGVTGNDLVYDLGAGDGRLVIAAATIFGARAVGVEIDPRLVQEGREAALRAGVAERVSFVWGDFFKTDLRPATAVMLYLLPEINLRLRPKLLEELRPGTPIVSHNFDMGEWAPDRSARVLVSGGSHRLYLWVVPARIHGVWSIAVSFADGDASTTAVFEQNFQRFSGVLRAPAGPAPIVEAALSGDIIGFSATVDMKPGTRTIRFRGRVVGDTIEGTAQVTGGLAIDPGRWTARRLRTP